MTTRASALKIMDGYGVPDEQRLVLLAGTGNLLELADATDHLRYLDRLTLAARQDCLGRIDPALLQQVMNPAARPKRPRRIGGTMQTSKESSADPVEAATEAAHPGGEVNTPPDEALKGYKRQVVDLFRGWKPNLSASEIDPLHRQATTMSAEAVLASGDGAEGGLALIRQFIALETDKPAEISVPETTTAQETPVSQALTTTTNTLPSAPPPAPSEAIVPTAPQSWLKLPTPAEQNYILFTAEMATAAGIYKSKGLAAICILRGFELGIAPAVAVTEIYAINGKPYPSSRVLRAVAMSKPDCLRFDVLLSEDGLSAKAVTQRQGGEIREFSYTWNEAVKAKLTTKDNWANHPKEMLSARVARRAVMEVFPEIAVGLGTDEDEA